MALIGNMTVANKSSGYFSSGIAGATRSNFANLSNNFSKAKFFPEKSSLGEGYNVIQVDFAPIKPGGIASIGLVNGQAAASAAILLVKTASISISGTVSITASLAVLTQGTGTIAGVATVSGAMAAVSRMTSTSAGVATVSGNLKANVPLAGSIAGVASSSVNLRGIANASGDIEIGAAVGLTASAVSSAVWAEIIEAGYSSSELLKLLASVSFGKTTIVDNGGGSATVTFRDLADTKDRVDADMVGSERSTVTLDAT